jgi:hypothetical protein
VDGVGRPAIGIAFIEGDAEVGIAAVVAGSRASGAAAIADVASVSISARSRRWLKGNAASGATTAARAARSAYAGRVAAPATKSGLAVENRIVARNANRSTCANGDSKRPRADGLGKLLNDAASTAASTRFSAAATSNKNVVNRPTRRYRSYRKRPRRRKSVVFVIPTSGDRPARG